MGSSSLNERADMADRTLDQRLNTLRRVTDTVNAFTSSDVQKLAFEWLIESAGVSAENPPAPRLLSRVLAAFDEAGDDRMHSEVLAAVLGFASTTDLAKQLAPRGIKPRPNSFERGGIRRRGYDRADVLAAIERLPGTSA